MSKICLISLCLFLIFRLASAQERQDINNVIPQALESNSQIPSKEEVFELIRLNSTDRVVVVTTSNADNSPHASVVGIWVQNGVIKLKASSDIAITRNLQRTRNAVITLYKIPEKGLQLSKHKGVRVWVKLIKNKEREEALKAGKSLKSYYSLEVVKIRSLQKE